MAMTEHNYVQDLQPVIDRLGLTDFTRATAGLELTSLEAGHWNAYPLSSQTTLTTSNVALGENAPRSTATMWATPSRPSHRRPAPTSS